MRARSASPQPGLGVSQDESTQQAPFPPYARPPPRSRHATVVCEDKVFVLGGSGMNKRFSWNDVAVLDTATWSWYEMVGCRGTPPPPCYGHAACFCPGIDGTSDFLVVMGGKTLDGTLLGGVWMLHLQTLQWQQPQVLPAPSPASSSSSQPLESHEEKRPPPRCYHSLTCVAPGTMVLFGGATDDGSGSCRDVWILRQRVPSNDDDNHHDDDVLSALTSDTSVTTTTAAESPSGLDKSPQSRRLLNRSLSAASLRLGSTPARGEPQWQWELCLPDGKPPPKRYHHSVGPLPQKGDGAAAPTTTGGDGIWVYGGITSNVCLQDVWHLVFSGPKQTHPRWVEVRSAHTPTMETKVRDYAVRWGDRLFVFDPSLLQSNRLRHVDLHKLRWREQDCSNGALMVLSPFWSVVTVGDKVVMLNLSTGCTVLCIQLHGDAAHPNAEDTNTCVNLCQVKLSYSARGDHSQRRTPRLRVHYGTERTWTMAIHHRHSVLSDLNYMQLCSRIQRRLSLRHIELIHWSWTKEKYTTCNESSFEAQMAEFLELHSNPKAIGAHVSPFFDVFVAQAHRPVSIRRKYSFLIREASSLGSSGVLPPSPAAPRQRSYQQLDSFPSPHRQQQQNQRQPLKRNLAAGRGFPRILRRPSSEALMEHDEDSSSTSSTGSSPPRHDGALSERASSINTSRATDATPLLMGAVDDDEEDAFDGHDAYGGNSGHYSGPFDPSLYDEGDGMWSYGRQQQYQRETALMDVEGDADGAAGLYSAPADALPMLYVKPAKVTMVRQLHNRLVKFESRGLSHSMARTNRTAEWKERTAAYAPKKKDQARREDEYDWNHFAFAILRLLFIPLFTLYYVFCTRRFTWKSRLSLLALSLVHLSCIALPVLGFVHPDAKQRFSGASFLLTPLIVYVVFVLMVGTIEGTWKDRKKEQRRLAAHSVTVWQMLVNGRHGFRESDAASLVSSITDREAGTSTRRRYILLVWVLPVIGGAMQGVLTFVWDWQSGDVQVSTKPIVHFTVALGFFLNFVMMGGMLFTMGIALTVYARHLNLLRYFSCITSKEGAERNGLPAMPLDRVENIMAWAKVRTYVKNHTDLPLHSMGSILGWSMLICVVLWILLILATFIDGTRNQLLRPINGLFLFNAILLSFYVGFGLAIGIRINRHMSKHLSTLMKEHLKTELRVSQLREDLRLSPDDDTFGDDRASDLRGEVEHTALCGRVLQSLVSMLQRQDNSMNFLGFQVTEGSVRAVLGLCFPLLVATIARLALDVSS